MLLIYSLLLDDTVKTEENLNRMTLQPLRRRQHEDKGQKIHQYLDSSSPQTSSDEENASTQTFFHRHAPKFHISKSRAQKGQNNFSGKVQRTD